MKRIVEMFVRFPFYANLVIVFLLIVGGDEHVEHEKVLFP